MTVGAGISDGLLELAVTVSPKDWFVAPEVMPDKLMV